MDETNGYKTNMDNYDVMDMIGTLVVVEISSYLKIFIT